MHPIGVELAVLEHAVLQHGVVTHLAVERAGRQLPDILREFAVLGIGDDQIGRQTVCERADLARGAAGRRLAGERERAVARLRNLSGQQVHVVDHVVDPRAARVLVEAHRPVGDDLLLRIGVELGEPLEILLRYAGHLGGVVERVGFEQLLVFLEADLVLHAAGILRAVLAGLVRGVDGLDFERVGRPQAVADILDRTRELDVLLDEFLVHRAGIHDVILDVIEDREIRLRRENQRIVGELERAVLEGREYVHFAAGMREPAIGEARPQDRMHLRHVRAPQDEGVGEFEIVVAPHRLIDAESADEAGDGGGHAVARVRIEIVGAETALDQFGRRIAFPDRPLSGPEHADRRRAGALQRGLEFLCHDREGFVPGDGREVAVLVVLAVLLAQQRLCQAILPVHDLGQEIALDAVEAAIDRGIRIALRGDDTTVLRADDDAASGAAEPAHALVPANAIGPRLRGGVYRRGKAGDARRRRDRGGLERVAPGLHEHALGFRFSGHGSDPPSILNG